MRDGFASKIDVTVGEVCDSADMVCPVDERTHLVSLLNEC